MLFKKIVILFLTFLICSCSPTRNDFYLGETGVQGWMEVTFVEYHITPINTDEFYLDYTLHLNMENNFPYKLKISETYVHGYWDPATNYNEAYEPQKMYTCNINKNIEKWVENNSNAKIIDCYDINEIESNLTSVMGSYNNILNTSGETKIENL